MTYSDAAYEARISELFERHQSVQSVGFSGQAYKPGLEGMIRLDSALGHPSRKFRSIHVAGTNGKGTVCCMLAAQLAARGLKVGLYTSPHLLDFRERMKIIERRQGLGSRMIPRQKVWDFLELAQSSEQEGDADLTVGQQLPSGPKGDALLAGDANIETQAATMQQLPSGPKGDALLAGRSFFEITTAMAFWWFAMEDVDIAVVETGLGGRLDSTNILVPELAVITSIGLDHCAILGDTRAKIAAEKAGIFKPGVPAVVGEYDQETAQVFQQAAAQVHCPLFFAQSEEGEAGLDVRSGEDQEARIVQGEMDGWAGVNLATVRLAMDLMGEEMDEAALADFAHITGLRGRWEKLVVDNKTLIFDIGHNPPALKRNFARLAALAQTTLPAPLRPIPAANLVDRENGLPAADSLQSGRDSFRPIPAANLVDRENGQPAADSFLGTVIVYGVMADKDLESIAHLLPGEAEYIMVAPDTVRALPVEALRRLLGELRPDILAKTAESVQAGLELAMKSDAGLVYVGGSTFVVSEALAGLELAL